MYCIITGKQYLLHLGGFAQQIGPTYTCDVYEMDGVVVKESAVVKVSDLPGNICDAAVIDTDGCVYLIGDDHDE